MLGLGIAGGVGLALIDWLLPFGFFSLMIMIGLGYAIGEGISAAVNRKRGVPLQFMAAGAVVIAVAVSALADLLVVRGVIGVDLFDLIGLGLAIVVAVNRLKA